MSSEIKQGRKIRDKVFKGDPYRQLGVLRESIWALAVLGDHIEGDKEKAEGVLSQSVALNQQVEDILNE